MKFYDRKNELATLKKIRTRAMKESAFTLVVGRRRVGKTALLMESFSTGKFLYLFVARKTEALLCEGFQKDAEDALGLMIYGNVSRFRDLFSELLTFSESHPFTLVIDEFQDFERVNKSIFSDIQNVWDRQGGKARCNLIVCGSVYSLMVKQFEDNKEPLFGRATSRLDIKPFTARAMTEILVDFSPSPAPEDMLCLYMLTGGVPKYMALLMDAGAFTKDGMLREAIGEGSVFLSDGKEMLVSEFGTDYSTYFSILQLIACGKTSQSEIDSVIGKNTGAYLNNLETKYSIISKQRPLFAKPGTRNTKWTIADMYLRFWFGFIYANQSLVESGRLDMLLEIVDGKYKDYSGLVLEDFFRKKLSEEGRFTKVEKSWDAKGVNEIDIVAVDDIGKRALIAEVKRDRRRFSEYALREKALTVEKRLTGYDIEYKGLSLEDVLDTKV
ncbi:MAG: ATP-binding protein [Clostridiales Family XIII bacterium]|jgi:AAA+ ATPase superfamily predicted ATPase|nr:ATP-binding protein [Clostridiales Family XIII bacterium]